MCIHHVDIEQLPGIYGIQRVIRAHWHTQEEVFIPGGSYHAGTDKQWFDQDSEGPAHTVELPAFFFDKYEVSNERFREFVQATHYKTEAEVFGWSFVHELALSEAVSKSIDQAVASVPWWLPVQQAFWFSPEGNDSDVWESKRDFHPVLHVSTKDAAEFCGGLAQEADCLPNLSGNVQRGAARKIGCTPGGTNSCRGVSSAPTSGRANSLPTTRWKTATSGPPQWMLSGPRTSGACTTCLGMCGSGRAIAGANKKVRDPSLWTAGVLIQPTKERLRWSRKVVLFCVTRTTAIGTESPLGRRTRQILPLIMWGSAAFGTQLPRKRRA